MRYKRTPLNETSQQFMTGILKCIGFFTTKLRTFLGTHKTQAYKSPPKVNFAHMPTTALVIKKLKHLFEEIYMLEPGHFSVQNS